MFIRAHLHYRDVIYHVPPVTTPFDSAVCLPSSIERNERAQYQAALAITGCWQGTNRNKLYDELGWARRIIHFYRLFCTNSPIYIYGHIPRQRILNYGC